MKTSISLFLVIILSGIFNTGSAQIYGEGETVSSIMAESIDRSAKALVNLASVKAEMKRALNTTRKNYWARYPNGPDLKKYAREYQLLLHQKDLLIFRMGFVKYVNKAAFQSDNALTIWAEKLTGGEVDGGISDYAKDEFKLWAARIAKEWGKTARNLYDHETLAKVMNDHKDLYAVYVAKRDLAEYWFHNPNTPLESLDTETYLTNLLLMGGAFTRFEDCRSYYQKLTRYISPVLIAQGVREFRRKGRHSELAYLERAGSGFNHLVELIEWHISKYDRQTYALYLIKRRFLCDWDLAAEILSNRVTRYGQTHITDAMTKVWRHSSNLDSICIGNPNDFGIKDRLQIPEGLSREKANEFRDRRDRCSENTDCLAEYLGPNTLWYDLLDWVEGKKNIPQLRSAFVTELKRELATMGDHTRQPEALYRKITSVFNEDLLLSAFYVHKTMGKNLEQSDAGGWYGGVHKAKGFFFANLVDGTFWLLDGLVSVKPDFQTMMANVFRTSYFGEPMLTQVDKAIADFNQYQTKYGLESMRKAYEVELAKSEINWKQYNREKVWRISTPRQVVSFFKRNKYGAFSGLAMRIKEELDSH